MTILLLKADQDGGAAADYSGLPARLVFASGETQKTFAFNVAQDTIDDDGESVALSFSTLPDRVSAGRTPTATLAITDDAPDVKVSFDKSSYTVDEGGVVSVTVILDQNPERTVNVPLIAPPGDNASADDFSLSSARVPFGPGATQSIVTVTGANDDVDDGGETVSLSFGTLPDRLTVGDTPTAAVSISDNDERGMTFDPDPMNVTDGSSAHYTVVLDTQPTGDVTVTVTGTAPPAGRRQRLTTSASGWWL